MFDILKGSSDRESGGVVEALSAVLEKHINTPDSLP